MSLDPVGLVEVFVYISVASLKGQINILNTVGYHRDRGQLIDNAKAMTLFLKRKLDESEEQIGQAVEKQFESITAQTAGIRDLLKDFAGKMGNPRVKEMALFADSSHNDAVNILGKKETELEKNTRDRFNKMRDDVQKVLSALEKMPR